MKSIKSTVLINKAAVLRRTLFLFSLGLLIAGSGCRPMSTPSASGPTNVRLAFFPNVTHAAALVGTDRKTFAEALGSGAKLEEQVFTAGPSEIEALFAGQVDIGYIGPGPAVNGFVKSNGKALRIIAGASSGGAALVVRRDAGVADIKGLNGKRVAVPQKGGTQDISLRHALQQAGLRSKDQGGTVEVIQTAPADTLNLFARKQLDAAWVPEPWVARLEKEGGGVALIDERDLWPGKRFATTVVIVRTRFLEEHPDLVQKFLRAHVETVAWIDANPDDAREIVGARIDTLTSKAVPDDILRAALSRTDITYDPLRESVLTFADWAHDLGYLRSGRDALGSLIDTAPLNRVLGERKQAAIR